MLLPLLSVWFAGSSATLQDADLPGAPPELGADARVGDELAQRWRDHVLPTEEETAWERIPWIPTFADGILAAHERGQPLLLWMMNGHPLGCT